MAERKIDYDRGVMIKIHPSSGMDVFMYMDDPGVYLNANGGRVNEKVAREAGYEITELAKKRKKKEMLARATQAINDELAMAEEGERRVLKDMNGIKAIGLPGGYAYVEDPEGARLTVLPIPQDVAIKLVEKLGETEPKGEEKTEVKLAPKKDADKK